MKSNKLIVILFSLIPFLCFSQSKREDEKYIKETQKLLSDLRNDTNTLTELNPTFNPEYEK